MLPAPGRREDGEINLESYGGVGEVGALRTPRARRPWAGASLASKKSFVQFETSLKKSCSGGRSQWSFEYETERPPSPFPIT